MPALATTEGELPSADEARGRTFPCQQCGADLVFQIGVQKLKCEHCGSEKDLSPGARPVSEQDLLRALENLRQRRGPAAPAAPPTPPNPPPRGGAPGGVTGARAAPPR